jgi:hypothetical protein
MGSDANRLRKKWQDYSGQNAGNAEHSFYETFLTLFAGTNYNVRRSITEFRDLYVNVELTDQELSEIHNPNVPITRHGVNPDYAITNNETNKTIYIEVKRQDGWVEGKTRADGRGNAHERSCKFFTPGLQKVLRTRGNLAENVIPFWVVFIGDITRDPCRVREVKLWYDGIPEHYFMWRDQHNSELIIEHFLNYIKPLID